ncbi:hypothetical protein EJ04DRAFT_548404 [Polyplosphaeria fusca]|uniref:Fungal STAND N-terminal Goodbye domain-containing protein n=1 Tax=Polyplosphaeria fusca TaxID=682080 RepID=A0A9P4V9C0_9PLEO|nr:hypothetical protein EJ04DRAFT_548404 [Polyplosphaeria fusca]
MSVLRTDLQAAWADACAEFEKATDYDFKFTSEAASAEDIVRRFDAAKAKDAEAHHKMDKAKAAVGKTMVAIERIGAIAAQGASMVFGSPADITMNCVSFFIDAGFAYKEIASNIGDLFGRIVTILERFQIYREYEKIMKDPMIRVAHRLLIAIVDICRLCVKRMRSNPFKKFAKLAFFSDDGGIKDQFAVLEALEKEELQMKGTLTLVAAETTQRAITAGFDNVKENNTKLMSSVAQLNDSDTDRKILDDIKERLGVDDSISTISKKEYQSHYDRLVSGNCAWLKSESDSLYKSWSDIGENQTLLILQGDEGCGKSYTFTAVVRDLLARYSQYRDDDTRVSIAYCYLTRGGKKDAQGSNTNLSIRDALREWTWQLVNKDVVYRKEVQIMFRQSQDWNDLRDMWQKLFVGRLGEDVNFFLLLDGTQELDERGVNDLSSLVESIFSLDVKRSRLKVAITARPSLVKTLAAKSMSNLPIVDLQEKNHEDVKSFVQEKANAMTIFQKANLEVQELKRQVCSDLLDAVKGNFKLAEIKLTEISTKYDPEEVRAILARARENAGLENSVLDHIRECNRTLNAREVEDLNTLLLWAIYGKWPFSIGELEAILYLQQGRASLQPLAKEINEKFSSFLEVSSRPDEADSIVSLKYDSIADYFKNVAKEQNAFALDTMAPKALTKGEIRMVRHFIEKLCDSDIYAKLGLGEFFDQKLSQSDNSVWVDCEGAHARIALACLRVTTTESIDEGTMLQPYATSYLSNHLALIDMDQVDPRLKAELGPYLVKMFRNPEAIRKSNMGMGWSYLDHELRSVVRLFRSSALTSKINTADANNQEWITTVLAESNPEIALLEESAKEMTRQWLSTDDGDVLMRSFHWLHGYINKIQHDENVEKPRIKNPPTEDQIKTDDIECVLRETQKLQPLGISDATRRRNVAITYRNYGHILESISQFKDMLAIDPDDPYAHSGLAFAYAMEIDGGPKPDWTKALTHLDVIYDGMKTSRQHYTSSWIYAHHVKTLLTDKASWLRKLGRYAEAGEIYFSMLEEDGYDNGARVEYLFTLYEAQQYATVVQALEDLDFVDEMTQRNRLTDFFLVHACNEYYHGIICQAAKHVKEISKIQGYYRAALKDVSGDKKDASFDQRLTACDLTYHFSAMLWNHGESAAEKEEAIELWEQLTDLLKNKGFTSHTQVLAARRLARIYIARAIEAGPESEVAAAMLEKVRTVAAVPNDEDFPDEEGYVFGLSTSQVRSLLGRYYSRVGYTEQAKVLLKHNVDIGIKLLSDDDDENDYQGYRKLGDAFMDFRDDANAIAAWSLIQPTIDDLAFYRSRPIPLDNTTTPAQAPTPESPDASPPLPKLHLTGPLFYTCDGRCGKTWTYSDDIYVCRECIDVQFDEPCLERLQCGALVRDICDKNHKFLHIPAWSVESAGRAEAGKVLVGEQEMEVKEWLEGIKRTWVLGKYKKIVTGESERGGGGDGDGYTGDGEAGEGV